jgi:hypothetical protein
MSIISEHNLPLLRIQAERDTNHEICFNRIALSCEQYITVCHLLNDISSFITFSRLSFVAVT